MLVQPTSASKARRRQRSRAASAPPPARNTRARPSRHPALSRRAPEPTSLAPPPPARGVVCCEELEGGPEPRVSNRLVLQEPADERRPEARFLTLTDEG